jgi:1-acyl-sn-glycerol-3-phosphate acyltransferase
MKAAAPRGGYASQARSVPAPLQRPSKAVLRFFAVYLSRYLPKHFHALRLAHAERWPCSAGPLGPLIVCVNHASWWDPMVCLRLSFFLSRAGEHYAPIDAVALARYGLLRKLGMFPVEQGTLRGAKQFLRRASAALARPCGVLWLTPQGSFADVRVRPVVFRAGLDALLRRMEQVTVLPLALEYTFWNERLPESLALFGEPLQFERGVLRGGAATQSPGAVVASALEQAQDTLAALALRRDPRAFTAIFSGRQGTGGVYGLWQRIRSAARGEGFSPEHGGVAQNAAKRADGKSSGAKGSLATGSGAQHND